MVWALFAACPFLISNDASAFARGESTLERIPVHEELTQDDVLPYITAVLSTGEVVRFSSERIADVARKNADTDDDQESSWLHFDNEDFDTASDVLFENRTSIVEIFRNTSRTGQDRETAITDLGESLHMVQDFYAHSNWVELGSTNIVTQLGDDNTAGNFPPIPAIGVEFCDEAGTVLVRPQPTTLTTGYYSGFLSSDHPAGKCLHGGIAPLGGGLNKDWSGRVGYTMARQLAKLASWNFVSKIVHDLDGNDAALCALMDDTTTPGCRLRPMDVTVQAGDGQATVTWQPVPDATSYNVYYAPTPSVSPANATGSHLDVNSPFVVANLTNGETYYFVVTAVVNGVETVPSSEASTVPTPVPTNVSVQPGDGTITIAWSPLDGASAYNVYYASEPGVTRENFQALSDGAVNSGVTSPAVITELQNGITYYLVVCAIVNGVESNPSAEVSATPRAVPTNVRGEAGDRQVTVSWPPLEGASSYNIYWATETGVTPANFQSLTGGATEQVVDSPTVIRNLTNGITYYFVVTAIVDGIESPPSSEIAISPLVAGGHSQIQVTAGTAHTCALVDTAVKCWGENGDGQLGDGTRNDTTAPVSVLGLSTGVIAVSAGLSHTCAVTNTGAVLCWGRNASGQLGTGDVTSRLTPAPVAGLSGGVKAIAAGSDHSCALTATGAVKCWGYNFYGVLGDGTRTARTSPVDVIGLSGVTEIGTGFYNTCALTIQGGVKCWGDAGGSGDGIPNSSATYTTPIDVVGLNSGVSALAVYGYHSCAIDTTNSVKCWGSNLGLTLGVNPPVPGYGRTPVETLGSEIGVTEIASGGTATHSCATIGGASLKCWGSNFSGQLGDGTAGSNGGSLPVDVVGIASTITGVAVGGAHTCAVTADGPMCWGSNYSGQLGDGTRTDRTTPVAVLGL